MKIQARKIDGTFDIVDSDDMAWRVARKAVIIQNGKILVIPQFDGYDFPGGSMNKGEWPVAAVKREVFEETGFEIKTGDLIGVYPTNYIRHGSGKAYSQINIFYFAEIVGGELTCDNFAPGESNYQRCPEFVDISYLENNQFKMYVDETPEIIEKIRLKMSDSPLL